MNQERSSNRISAHSLKIVPTISHQQMQKQTTFTYYSFIVQEPRRKVVRKVQTITMWYIIVHLSLKVSNPTGLIYPHACHNPSPPPVINILWK